MHIFSGCMGGELLPAFRRLVPTSVATGYSLTNNGTTVEASSATNLGRLRSSGKIPTGKYYFEMKVDLNLITSPPSTEQYVYFGIHGYLPSLDALSTPSGTHSDLYTSRWAFVNRADFQPNGGTGWQIFPPNVIVAGDVIKIAIDTSIDWVWFGVNENWGGHFGGDPSTGTGGYNMKAPGNFVNNNSEYYIAVSMAQTAELGKRRVTLTQPGSWQYGPPTGFS